MSLNPLKRKSEFSLRTKNYPRQIQRRAGHTDRGDPRNHRRPPTVTRVASSQHDVEYATQTVESDLIYVTDGHRLPKTGSIKETEDRVTDRWRRTVGSHNQRFDLTGDHLGRRTEQTETKCKPHESPHHRHFTVALTRTVVSTFSFIFLHVTKNIL